MLFPPAGWIMFFRVTDDDGRAEVYGVRGGTPELIDPHRIFATRWLGYDNIRRNVLVTALNGETAPQFCAYLRRKFPNYDSFVVVAVWTPSVSREPDRAVRQPQFQCHL